MSLISWSCFFIYVYLIYTPLSFTFFFFFFNDTATTEIYTLSLHDALPIFVGQVLQMLVELRQYVLRPALHCLDRKSTRLNSSHGYISYAVFCLKKKKKKKKQSK